MARRHVESIHAYDVSPEEVQVGLFAGTTQRLLSVDEHDGSSTSLITFPAGWEGSIAGSRPVELLALSGRGALARRTFVAGSWAWVGAGAVAVQLTFAVNSDVLVMVEAERAPTGGIETVDIVDARFEAGHAVSGVPPGLAVKTLRVDSELGDKSWITGTVPGWLGFRGEIHPTVEEAFLVRGDCLLKNSGQMVAGDYFWRPAGVHHGPFATRAGMLYFFRIKGGGMQVEWDDPEGWDREARTYYDGEPWFVPGR